MAPQKELIVKIKGDNSDFKKSMNEVSTQTSTINDKFKTVGSALGKVALAAGAAYAVFQSGQAVIRSSSDASDKLEKVTAGLTMGFQQLSRNLLALDFTNFTDSVSDAVSEGMRLAEMLDDLQDRTRSLSIFQSEYGAEIAALREDASDEKVSLQGRIASIKEAIRLQEELNDKQKENAERAAEIAMQRMVSETKLSAFQIKQFLSQYNNVEALRNQALRYNEEFERLSAIMGGDEAVRREQERLKNNPFAFNSLGFIGEANDLVKAYADMLKKYGKAADTTIDGVVQSIVNLNNTIAQGSMSIKGLNRQLNGLTPNVKPLELGVEGGGIKGGMPDMFTPNFKKIQAQAQLNRKFLFDAILEPWKEILTQVNDVGSGVSISIKGTFSEINGQMVADIGAIKTVIVDLGQAFTELATGAVVSLAESLGTALSGGGLKSGLDNILLMVADWAANLGQILISAGLAMAIAQKTLAINPMAAVGFGIALVAAAAAIKGAVNSKPMGRGSSSNTSNQGGQDWDAFGLRGLRGMTVEVNGVLKAQGRDLVAVISSENNRKGL
jgi:hypothetical protein